MKKIYLLSIVLFIVCVANAQTEFSVPTPTMEQKYNLAKNYMYNNILVAISLAKSEGMTVEEYSKKAGEAFAPGWNQEMGFEQFVNSQLNIWTRLSDDVQIIEQSNEKVVIAVSSVYQPLEDQGVILGTSLEELVQWLDIVFDEIANHLDLSCNIRMVEEGYQVEITQ